MSAVDIPARRPAECLGVPSGERVAIVHNPAQEAIVQALADASAEGGAHVDLVGFAQLARHGEAVLEDEQTLGTIHVAFGASGGSGGVNDAGVHPDAITRAPTLVIGEGIVCEGCTLLPTGRSV
jgi:leucyl aminopeptidase (aminopeptidase T)